MVGLFFFTCLFLTSDYDYYVNSIRQITSSLATICKLKTQLNILVMLSAFDGIGVLSDSKITAGTRLCKVSTWTSIERKLPLLPKMVGIYYLTYQANVSTPRVMYLLETKKQKSENGCHLLLVSYITTQKRQFSPEYLSEFLPWSCY